MARFTAVVDVGAPAEEAWRRVTDWPSHGRWVPLTSVRVLTDRPDGVGARFVGRTGIGPLGFDDPMEVVEWSPPDAAGPPGSAASCRVVKQGRVVHGGARVDVVPLTPTTCRVLWEEDAAIAPPRRVTAVLDPLLAWAGRVMFTRMLRAMAREAEHAAAGGPAGG